MTRLTRFAVGVAGLIGVCALAVGTGGAATQHKAKADSGTAFIGETHTTGSGTHQVHYEGGNIADKVLGAGAVTFHTSLNGTGTPGVVHFSTNTVTFWTKNGSLTGTASADIRLVT